MDLNKVKIQKHRNSDDQNLVDGCNEVQRLGIEGERYIKFKYHILNDEEYLNSIYIVDSGGIYIVDSDGIEHMKIERIPEGIYNYIVFLNDSNEFIMTLTLFNPQEIATKHIHLYNRLNPDNPNFDSYILSGELDLKYNDPMYRITDYGESYNIIFNDSSSFYWFNPINFKKEVFIQILKDIIPELEETLTMELPENWQNSSDRTWEKYIIEKVKLYGIDQLHRPFAMINSYQNFKKLLEQTENDNPILRKNAYVRLATMHNSNFNNEKSIYIDEINKLMKLIFSSLSYYKDIDGTIEFGEVEKVITNNMFFRDLCNEQLESVNDCVEGKEVLVREGNINEAYYNKKGIMGSCEECGEDQYKIDFPMDSSRCVDKYNVYSDEMSEFLERFNIYDDYDDCEQNRNKTGHLCDFF